MEKAIFKVDELAVHLGISRPKAYELAHSDGFPRVTVGRRILIPAAGLEQWLADQASKNADDRGEQG